MKRYHSKAFTVIELLVVIVVIAIVLTISLFAIRSTSQVSADSATLARLRSHIQIFSAYSTDYDQRFPLIMKIGQPLDFVTFGRYAIRTDYFGANAVWPYALAEKYYEGDPESQAFQPARTVLSGAARRGRFTGFWYSSSFLADPKFWNYQTRTGPDQWRATRQDEVRFTSKKVLFYTHYPYQTWNMNAQRAHGFGDGSAAFTHARDMRPAYSSSTGPWPGRGQFGGGIPGMHTIDGIHGRDID